MKSVYIGSAAAALSSSIASAAFSPGTEVFTNMAGTGTVSVNGEARNGVNGSGWYDYSTSSSSTPYRHQSLGALVYEESWGAARPIGTLFLASPGQETRGTSGNIYVKPTVSDPFTLVTTFNNSAQTVSFTDVNVASAVAIRVEITGPANDGYRQLGSLGIYEERFGNIAQGLPKIFNADAQSKGDVTDQYIRGDALVTQFRSNPSTGAGEEEFVGVQFASTKSLLGLLVDVSPFDAWAWTNFDVQVFRGGSWITLGRADATPATDDLYWVDFGGVELADAVRLYGSTTGGNNPGQGGGAGQGQIISEIMAFEFVPVPEPAGLGLLGMAGLLLRRRTR